MTKKPLIKPKICFTQGSLFIYLKWIKHSLKTFWVSLIINYKKRVATSWINLGPPAIIVLFSQILYELPSIP